MGLDVEMRPAGRDMEMDEPRVSVEVPLWASVVGPPTHELRQQKHTASNAHYDRVFLTTEFGHERSDFDCLIFTRDLTKVMNKHVEVLQQHSNEEPITDFLVCTE
jgi:hypothetical protein